MQQQLTCVYSRNVMRMQVVCIKTLVAATKQGRVSRSVACCIQVVQTDEAVFEAVQDKFVALTANLLPKLVRALTLFIFSAGCGRSFAC